MMGTILQHKSTVDTVHIYRRTDSTCEEGFYDYDLPMRMVYKPELQVLPYKWTNLMVGKRTHTISQLPWLIAMVIGCRLYKNRTVYYLHMFMVHPHSTKFTYHCL